MPADVDECHDNVCTHGCFNTYGSFMCNCDEGFELAADGTSCIGERRGTIRRIDSETSRKVDGFITASLETSVLLMLRHDYARV